MTGAREPRVFVVNEDGTFLCPDCVPPTLDLGSDGVATWLEGSDGWLGTIACSVCGGQIDVVVDDLTE